MMEQQGNNKTFRLTMLELVIVIGIFTILSILIVQMFVGTNRLQNQAVDLSKAMITVESLAEEMKQVASINEVEELYSLTELEREPYGYVIYYDRNWERTSEEDTNIIIIHASEEIKDSGRMITADIRAFTEESSDLVIGASPISQVIVKSYHDN